MDKILVTGVAGFIGSNLASYLLKNENNIVIGIDNFSSSTMSNLYPLLKNSRFEFLEHDLSKSITSLNTDYVYHLAGCGDLSRYFDNKYEFMLEQIQITKNIINFSIQNGAKLLLTTQNCSYEEQNEKYFKYYDTIRIIQSLVLELIESNKISAVFASLDYVYGENLQKEDSRFISKAIVSASLGQNIVEEYDESFYFTYVGDVVCNLVKLMLNYSTRPIIDICNHNLYLKSDIIKLIINYLKSNSKFETNSISQYNPNYKPEIALLDNGIELTCKTPVLEGILKTIQYFKLMYFS
ncbi:NAD-dependent epimerase/dehydratase family protein [bacterium]|nr:NAD-dependent epimerase/dehydratase family protein [bacterium]